jgi:hypothetical protein
MRRRGNKFQHLQSRFPELPFGASDAAELPVAIVSLGSTGDKGFTVVFVSARPKPLPSRNTVRLQ